ncbi:MAG: flippase [bacterium]|nr:flippase [bacterium]
MSLTRKIAHNTLYQIIGKLFSTAIGIVVVAMLARYLGAEGYGQYTIVIVFLQLFAVLLDLGLYIILIKKLSEPGADMEALVSNVFTLRILSAIVFLGIAPIVVLAFPYPGIVKAGIALTTLSYLFISLNQVLTGLFQKELRMGKVALAEVFGRIVLLGATAVVLWLEWQLMAVLFAVVLGSFANFLYVFISARRLVDIRLRFNWPVWLAVLRDAWPIGISVALNLIYFKADAIILSLYHPAADVGIYGATYKVLEILITLPAMFAGLVMPLLTAAYVTGDRERFRQIIQRSINFLAILALPLIVGTQFIAEPLMILVAGEEFTASGGVLRILIIATGIIFVGALFGNSVVSVNKQKPMIWMYAAAAAVSLLGYYLFIPTYSYYGAAWMTVVSEFLIMIGAYFMIHRTISLRLKYTIVWRAALATAVMAAGLWLLRDWSWYFLAISGTVIYFIVLYAIKGISTRDVKEVISLRSS